MEKEKVKQMDRNEAIELLKNMHWSITTKMNREVPSSLALLMAIEALGKDINVPSKSALDHIHNVVKDDAYKRGCEQGKADAVPAVSVNSNTFMIDVSEEDFDKIKRVIVGCGPMCRTFYEEGGEAHWIKSYTPDDGEIYECDNCGVTWAFNDGGPEENEAHYCPKCGFKMVPKEGEQNGQTD